MTTFENYKQLVACSCVIQMEALTDEACQSFGNVRVSAPKIVPARQP